MQEKFETHQESCLGETYLGFLHFEWDVTLPYDCNENVYSHFSKKGKRITR